MKVNLKELHRGPKGFITGFVIASIVAVFLIVVVDKATANTTTTVSSQSQQKGCDRACRKREFQQNHVQLFNQGDLGHTPDALYERGRMKAKLQDWYNGSTAKAYYAKRGCTFGCWWDNFKDGASCAVTLNTDSCVKTATGPAADDFVTIWNNAVDVTVLCGVPTVLGAAAASPEAPWAGAGYAAGACFWGVYFEKTH